MKRWWWPFGPESRQLPGESGIGAYVNDLANYYSSTGQADVHQTAAVELVLGMIARAFLLANVVPATPALDPLTVSMLARQTLALGNAVFEIDFDGRNIQLLPVAQYDISGQTRPTSWNYRFRQQRPNGDSPLDLDQLPRRVKPYRGMVHVRYMPSPTAPWVGVSPLTRAGLTAKQLAYIERSLQYDSMPRGGVVMPMPDGASQTQYDQIEKAFSSGLGGMTAVETTQAGFGAGVNARPTGDYDQKRFGAVIPPASIEAREKAMEAVMDACGVPSSLHRSDGAAQRESYRHFFTATIEPIAALIAAELSEKLERKIVFEFPQAFKSDVAARARALKPMMTAGVKTKVIESHLGLPAGSIEEPPEPDALPAPQDDGTIPDQAHQPLAPMGE